MSPLVLFKYWGFGLNSVNHILGMMHTQPVRSTFALVLPIGISFYTFEAISYSVDIYRNKIERPATLLDFALFLAFFPRMVAGPIMRAGMFIPQCETPRRVNGTEFAQGFTLLIFGLFQKVILADLAFAPAADQAYALGTANNVFSAWVGTVAFGFQIYFDFAGYSTSAIGIARMLGFILPPNFNSPYSALNFSDFWQRWHISLSSWLRDYLYIPLGGNRLGALRTKVNLMLTMALGGLWHGAAWRFMAWGILHGTYLVGQRVPIPGLRRLNPAPLVCALFTFVLVCIGWVFFRATSFAQAFHVCAQMVGLGGEGTFSLNRSTCLAVCLLAPIAFAFQWNSRNENLDETFDRLGPALRTVTLAGMLVALLFAPGDNRAFIYFQF
jgi:alginate O-acetyltransferase complex protein AlgI